MTTSVSVEERLRRAAEVLDSVTEGPRADVHPLPAPRRGRVRAPVGVGALAAAVALVVGAVSLLRSPAPYGVVAARPMPALAPGSEGWEAMPAAPVGPRFQHLAVATDDGVFVWGGHRSEPVTDGAYFDVGSRTWRKLPRAPLAGDRGDAIGVWTGREVVVLNGVQGHVKAASFSPSTFSWTALPDPPLSNSANAMSRALYVDGTVVVVAVAEEGDGASRIEVAHFDPVARAWSIGESPPKSFSSFFSAVAVADRELVVVARRDGGGKSCGSAVVLGYRPSTRSWRELPGGPIDDLLAPAVVWTGRELFVGGGPVCPSEALPLGTISSGGELLDVATDEWRATSGAPLVFEGNYRYDELWTGSSVLTFNRDGTPVLYDPAADTWHIGPRHPIVSGHHEEAPWVWLDGRAWLFSGGVGNGEGCCDVVDGGYSYQPPPGFW